MSAVTQADEAARVAALAAGAGEDQPPSPMPFMRVDATDWAALSPAARVRHFEVEGYCVLPRVLDAALVATLKAELEADGVEMTHKSYSSKQTFSRVQPQWLSPAAAALVAHPPTARFLHDLLGDGFLFTRGFYQKTFGGSPGIALHTDAQPHGSDIFGYEGSCPRLLRVLYYLDDLTPTRAPFRLVPRSHLSFHRDANPYERYAHHPDEVTLCVPAGGAVVMAAHVFHGTHPNVDCRPRSLLQYGYRPAWAGPAAPVDEWPAAAVAAAPACARPFLRPLNTTGHRWTQPHRPGNMRTDGPGLALARWGPPSPG